MRRSHWNLPAETVTEPDQIDARALAALELLDGERLVRCWRTAVGFLVMTDLRCLHVWRRPELFTPSEWHEGTSFFFYDLGPPSVVAGRFLQLVEQGGAQTPSERFLVRHPEEVRMEIEGARPEGRAAWERRRALAELRPHPTVVARPGPTGGVVHEIVHEVIKVRCRFCGNLMDVSDPRCRDCGAPQR